MYIIYYGVHTHTLIPRQIANLVQSFRQTQPNLSYVKKERLVPEPILVEDPWTLLWKFPPQEKIEVPFDVYQEAMMVYLELMDKVYSENAEKVISLTW